MQRHKRKTPSVTSTQLSCTSSPASQPGTIAQTPRIRQNRMLGCSAPIREHAGPAALAGNFLGRCSPARSSKGRTKPVLARGPNWFENLGTVARGMQSLCRGNLPLPLHCCNPALAPWRGVTSSVPSFRREVWLSIANDKLPPPQARLPGKALPIAGHLQPAHVCW